MIVPGTKPPKKEPRTLRPSPDLENFSLYVKEARALSTDIAQLRFELEECKALVRKARILEFPKVR